MIGMLMGISIGKNWNDARENCQKNGGDLFVIRTYQEVLHT